MRSCEAHGWHRPAHLTVELHHVVPQAWQRFWSPADELDPEPLTLEERIERVLMAAAPLWFPLRAALCPTGHRNVHFHIVRLMRASDTNDPRHARTAYRGRTKEYRMAYRALTEFHAAGGSLVALREARLWGGAS